MFGTSLQILLSFEGIRSEVILPFHFFLQPGIITFSGLCSAVTNPCVIFCLIPQPPIMSEGLFLFLPFQPGEEEKSHNILTQNTANRLRVHVSNVALFANWINAVTHTGARDLRSKLL